MMLHARQFEMPLLLRELKQLANRPRTYIVRFAYAAVLFVAASLMFYGSVDGSVGTPFFGRGRAMFERLVLFQFWGIVAVLPATTSGVLSIEKERNSLGVLMLTTLGPGRIVIQKLLSRLIPMLSFVLLSMPLMAIAFSFGGVTQEQLWIGVVGLFVTCLVIGTLAMIFSAMAQTTPSALIGTYIGFTVVYLIFHTLMLPHQIRESTPISSVCAAWICSVAAVAGGLVLASALLVLRAFAPPRNLLMEIFKVLDDFFNEVNQVTGGVVLVRDRNLKPVFAPVAWRETARKSLGTFRYLFRILVVLELPVLFACQLVNVGMSSGVEPVHGLLYVIWCIALPLVAVHAASVISSERSRQTLDLLLTTPLAGHEIIRQKFTGVRRMITVLSVPFLTIFLFDAWWFQGRRFAFVFWSTLTVVVYLPLTAWIGLWIGLVTRTQLRAVLVTIVVVAAIILLPVALRSVLTSLMLFDADDVWTYTILISPADMISEIEIWSIGRQRIPIGQLVTHFGLFACLLAFCRYLALHDSDRRLGRIGLRHTRVSNFVPPAVAVLRET